LYAQPTVLAARLEEPRRKKIWIAMREMEPSYRKRCDSSKRINGRNSARGGRHMQVPNSNIRCQNPTLYFRYVVKRFDSFVYARHGRRLLNSDAPLRGEYRS